MPVHKFLLLVVLMPSPLTDRDSQLDVAVRELLKQLGTQRSTSPR